MAAGSHLLLLFLLPWLVTASHSPPGCKIRITSKGLDLGKRPQALGRGRLGHSPGWALPVLHTQGRCYWENAVWLWPARAPFALQ